MGIGLFIPYDSVAAPSGGSVRDLRDNFGGIEQTGWAF
jgi:hypothetical protein